MGEAIIPQVPLCSRIDGHMCAITPRESSKTASVCALRLERCNNLSTCYCRSLSRVRIKRARVVFCGISRSRSATFSELERLKEILPTEKYRKKFTF